MISRLVRWALWSPSHLGIAIGGVLVLVLGVALVFRPTSDGTEQATGVPASATSSIEASPTGSPGATGGSGSRSRAASPHPTVTAADAEAVTVTTADQAVNALYRNFTKAWLSGLGAVTVPGWVEDVCQVGCTPYLRQMLGTVAPRSIPDATVKKVAVDEIAETQSVGRVLLSDGQWLRLTAEWDGHRWLVSGIESA